jgi:alanine racemase
LFTSKQNLRNPFRKQMTTRPTFAEINLDHLAFNFHSVRSFVGEEIEFMAVVKADAYGHGAVECAGRLDKEGVDWFAVATVEEGFELRAARIVKPILILGGVWRGQESTLLDLDLTPVVFRIDQAEALARAATQHGKPARVHVKIDTGMGRIGFRADESDQIAGELAAIEGLEVEGLMTHFATADDLSASDFTNKQISLFEDAVEKFYAAGHRPKYVDMANSPGAIVHPVSRSRLVRIGGLLYGLGGDVLPAGVDQPELKPVMSIRSKIAQLKTIKAGESVGYGRTFTAARDTLIATVPIGYHDGLPRTLSNIGHVIIRGQRVPIVGRVSMDWTTTDVTDVEGVSVGDDVTIIGSDGAEQIKAEDLAELTNTISYEITCGISPRVNRRYIP